MGEDAPDLDALLDESAEELYEHAPAGYFSSLLDGTIVKANETLLEWTGHERDALVGRKRFHDLLAPGSRIYYETHYAPLLQMQGHVSQIAAELLRVDGTRLPVLLASTVVADEQGRPRVVRTTAVDVSERRRYERELLRARAEAESRAQAALALAHVVEGVLLVGEDGTVQLLNEAAEGILGVGAAAVTGRRADEALEGWAPIAARVPVRRVGERPATEVLPLVRGGEERWVAVAAADAGGAVVYTLRDVTADRDLDRLRADMVAIVSHELRTPLTGVYGAAQTLLARFDDLGDDERRGLIEMAVVQSGRLAKILDEILVTSSLDADTLAARIVVVDAAAVVDPILQGVDPAERRRVIVDAPQGLQVRADLDRLRQVVANLVDNALKYSSGPVRVAVAARDLSARFTVADDGPGIPAAERDRVFEKFFRLDPDQNRGVGGTGLGLYIARELVHRMDGRIGLLPRDRGTTIFVDVPLAPGERG